VDHEDSLALRPDAWGAGPASRRPQQAAHPGRYTVDPAMPRRWRRSGARCMAMARCLTRRPCGGRGSSAELGAGGPAAVDLWTIEDMGHGFPVDAGAAARGQPGGHAGAWVVDAGVGAAGLMGAFWGLDRFPAPRTRW